MKMLFLYHFTNKQPHFRYELHTSLVNPHTNIFAYFQRTIIIVHTRFRQVDFPSTLRNRTQYKTSHAVITAFNSSKVDKVQVVLLAHPGTFAWMSNLSVSGKDLRISRTKYLAPTL